jgi:hypothetical protein
MGLDPVCTFRMDIRFVDTDQSGQVEMGGHLIRSMEVIQAGHGRLGHDKNEIGA